MKNKLPFTYNEILKFTTDIPKELQEKLNLLDKEDLKKLFKSKTKEEYLHIINQ